MGRKQDYTYRLVSQDETKCFSVWNEQFHGMKQNVSFHETVTFLRCHCNAFNNDMQYLIECSEKIVRDNPKS